MGVSLLPFPLGNFVEVSVEDEDIYNDSLFKQNNSLEKNSKP